MPPPPRTAPPWSQVPLARRRSGRVFGGVLAGIATAHGIDVKLARVVVGIGAFVFPPTIPIYLAAWVLLPREPEPGRAPADLIRGGGRTWLAVGLAFLAFLAFMDGGWGPGPGRGANLLGAAVLLGLGAWLWSLRSGSPPAGAATADVGPTTWPGPPGGPSGWPTPASGPTGGGWPTPSADLRGPAGPVPVGSEPWLAGPPWQPGPSAPVEPPPPPPPPGPPVGRITLAAALIAMGAAVAGDRIGWYRLDVAAALALLLGTFGLGLVAGAVFGGGRALIAPAAVLLALTVGAAALGRVHVVGAVGERMVRPITVAEAENRHEYGLGQLTVDLRQLDWGGATVVDVPVDLGIGELRVLVPAGTDVEVDADVSIGEVEALGRTASGLGAGTEDTFRFDDPTTDRLLRLDLEVGIGHVDVQRVPAGPGAR